MKKRATCAPEQGWELWRARVALGPHTSAEMDISVRNGKITSLRPSRRKPRSGSPCLDLRGFLVMPGLINSHDHLEFNLFPRLGTPPYRNATAWAKDIYHPECTPVREHLAVPFATRLQWGGVKNLLSGATTVCHHNPFHSRTFTRRFAVGVPRRYGWAHSLQFCPDLVERFRATPADWPFVVHLGEAVDSTGREEVWMLDGMGALDSRTVLVHAVALDEPGLQLVRRRRASLVWCPTSNAFVLGRTLGTKALNSGIPVALGTDSALTGEAGLLEEIRFAAQTCHVPDARLYEMVTSEAAQVMRLNSGEGRLVEGGVADLLVVKDSGKSPAATLVGLSTRALEYVFVRGEIRMASVDAAGRLPDRARGRFHALSLDGSDCGPLTLCLDLDVAKLLAAAKAILKDVAVAHRKVLRAA